jgi:hypothetical protein
VHDFAPYPALVQILVQIQGDFGSISRDAGSEYLPIFTGGEGEIRTHGSCEGTPVFKTGAFNRSATSPCLIGMMITRQSILCLFFPPEYQPLMTRVSAPPFAPINEGFAACWTGGCHAARIALRAA